MLHRARKPAGNERGLTVNRMTLARVAWFRASDEASYITRQVWTVNGLDM